jgi:hypothetical protein
MLPKLGAPGFELLAKYFPDNMTASRKKQTSSNGI